ncbi:FAD-binding dehydrogenase [Aeromicrobium wangtongii]|uniref:FAD-binding dehydrogenase n=1 Tax=Aeromicrobium wangtongii TaxID=2969247 RepID=A0ABY5M264_9ACTN|nr:FAD-binding dehydrogenase [Aeromicrobium wangtongii]MCD9198275.1 FAD-binding dehydrogenase [Aeromicrobium wangtongii]UUP12308.1 FAD-binding dehydrogenase [Aeromicrobium wangtongii]
MNADVIVVGAGLAGLVATAELVQAGRSVVLVDQEGEQGMGGQAYWSFGGLFLVDSPQQRRMGIKDSVDLALQDWAGSAQFDRDEDLWPRRWAEAYVHFAAGEKQAWLKEKGHSIFPVVGWAERGGGLAGGHGNSVPRFHITWGTGPGIVEPFERIVRAGHEKGLVQFAFRHQVDELMVTDGVVTGVSGHVLEPTDAPRAAPTSRTTIGQFSMTAQAVIVTSGGIGGNHDLVRASWPARLGTPPEHMISGVPEHVDGRMLAIAEKAGASHVNRDRMWHYVEGIKNFDPIWPMHGIRILPGPSSMWLDGGGRRLPVPGLPGFDTLGTLKLLRNSGHDHSWFVLTQAIIEKEFALSGQEQNPDLTGKSVRTLVKERLSKGATSPVEAFKSRGEDFVVADTIEELVAGMNRLTPDAPVDVELVRRQVQDRDRELDNDFTKDLQIAALRQARSYRGDKLIRVASPHKLLDPAKGPLIAVRLHVLTRKSLGGLETDLDSRVLGADGTPLPGLYAAGEVAGFGGGGVHGYNSLEGTFLGGCLFSGRAAGRAAALQVV